MCVHLSPPTFAPWAGTGCGREVAVLMSGGVDSSVSALRLRDEGWRILGVTMNIPTAGECEHPAPCCGAEAALVCSDLGIPHYFVEVKDAFESRVVEPFRRAYAAGRTPNPCVDCNTFLKFGLLWDLLEKTFGIRHLATGHYARVQHEGGRSFLRRGRDEERDQSYFIYGIPPARLPRFLLPVGDMSKPEVRGIAEKHGLRVAAKPDSMELCFAGEGDYRNALEHPDTDPGDILDTRGNLLGRHRGIWNYTIGQRRGLGISAPEPFYVLRIDVERNALVVGSREEASRSRIRAGEVNVLIPEKLVPQGNLHGKIRSYSEPVACTVATANADELIVDFAAPCFGPCPGQHLVLYDDEGRVVAGGVIRSAEMEEQTTD